MITDFKKEIITVGMEIINQISPVMPYQKYLGDSSATLNGKLKPGVMSDCTNIRPLLIDLLGQYCFNFIGELGGYKYKKNENRLLSNVRLSF